MAIHLHANSIVSGVLYLTHHESALLIFHKPEGGQFTLSNFHDGVALNEYNAPRGQAGETSPGDLILFPSHLLHSVPANLVRGGDDRLQRRPRSRQRLGL